MMLAQGDVAGVLVATPNRFGILEDYTGLADEAHSAKALLAIYANPSALAVIKTPGEWDADIACGDAQPLGIPLNYGGPALKLCVWIRRLFMNYLLIYFM